MGGGYTHSRYYPALYFPRDLGSITESGAAHYGRARTYQ